jgi:short-subunit dehydrogenase
MRGGFIREVRMEKPKQPEVVVITGASAGLGRAAVREFAKEGARIGLIARGRDGLVAAKKEVEEAGGQALVLPLDVADSTAVDAAASAVEDAFGPIDVWVNNAMLSVFSPVKLMHAEEYKRVTDVTYLGYVYGTLAALKRMLPRDRGVILQVGSALAYRSIPLQSAYCAAKHAIEGFSESLRTELLHDKSNLRVTVVQMPALNTTQFSWARSRLPNEPQPIPPIYQPEVGARAIVWAAHNDRRELYVAWPTVKAIVLGEKLAPSLGGRYLAKHGYEDQQTDHPAPPDRLDNLLVPVPGDHGSHGTFDDRAHATSLELWVSTHRSILGWAGLALAAAAMALFTRTERSFFV